jgi:hypothetical protein
MRYTSVHKADIGKIKKLCVVIRELSEHYLVYIDEDEPEIDWSNLPELGDDD